MVGPQEDNSSSLCMIDTAVRNRVSVKIGDMILEIDMLISAAVIQPCQKLEILVKLLQVKKYS